MSGETTGPAAAERERNEEQRSSEGPACLATHTRMHLAFPPPRSDPLFKTVIRSGPSSAAAASSSSSGVAAPPTPAVVDSRAIWSAAEVAGARELEEDSTADGRLKPDYDVLYAQSLSAEDVFMGLGTKDPSTASCEAIVVKVFLPRTNISEVTLDVTPTRIMVRSNK